MVLRVASKSATVIVVAVTWSSMAFMRDVSVGGRGPRAVMSKLQNTKVYRRLIRRVLGQAFPLPIGPMPPPEAHHLNRSTGISPPAPKGVQATVDRRRSRGRTRHRRRCCLHRCRVRRAGTTPPPQAASEIGDSTGDPNPVSSTTQNATQFAKSKPICKLKSSSFFGGIFFCYGFDGKIRRSVALYTKCYDQT